MRFVELRHIFSDKALSTDWRHLMDCFTPGRREDVFPRRNAKRTENTSDPNAGRCLAYRVSDTDGHQKKSPVTVYLLTK